MATTVTLKPNAIDISGSTSGTTTLQATAVAGTTTLTLPAATDTLVGKATTDTLTNKTLTSPTITGVATFAAGAVGTPSITTTGDTNTGIFFPAADTIAFAEGGAEVARFDSSGNLLVATTNANQNVRIGQKLGVVSTGSGTYGGVGISSYSGTSNVVAPVIDISRSRGTTDQSFTAVVVDDILGYIVFRGSDGTGFTDAAYIQGAVDGTVAANQVPSRLMFYTANSAGTVTERARFNSTGAFVLAGGTTTADGIGITFPATQSASSNANTLDDYEEGTWTPTFTSITGSPTGTARYVKIGRQVTLTYEQTGGTFTCTGGSGQISGIPFAGIGGTGVVSACGAISNTAVTSVLALYNASTTGVMYVTGTFTAASGVGFSITYFV